MENRNKRPLEDECKYVYKKTKKPKASLATILRPKPFKQLPGFQGLSDDVIMYLFKYLSHDDLAKMTLICPNLSRVSHDWTLWKKPSFEKYKKAMEPIYIGYLLKQTSELYISSNDVPSSDYSVSKKFLVQLQKKCPELLHLTLKNQVFDASQINVKVLHQKLKSLTIDHTTIENIPETTSYLSGINNTCPDLERIEMTNNDWFLPNCLYALAKLEHLQSLSLAGCKMFKDCIPYASITAITGFKSLQTLDLRLTPVSDHELVCFQRLTSLKNLFLECPDYIDHAKDATITDIGLAGFFNSNFDLFQYPYIQILIDRHGGVNLRRVHDRCSLETLCVRNYPKVTDLFLRNASHCCPYLKSLDITGTRCTSEEIDYYKTNRPCTKLVYSEED